MLYNTLQLGGSFIGGGSGGGGLAPLSMPSGASAIYSIWRVGDYGGDCCTIVRASDDAELDIPFVDNYWDISGYNTFISGSSVKSITLYDQSGNDRHATQTVDTAAPYINPENLWAGTVNGITHNGDFFDIPSSVSIDRRSCTIYCAFAAQAFVGTTSVWAFNSTFANGIALNPGVDGSTRLVSSSFASSGIFTPTQPVINTVASSASGWVMYENEKTSATGAALSSSTSNGGYLGKLNHAGWVYYGETFLFAAYAGVTHDAETIAGVHSQIYSRLNINTNKRRRILLVGDSLTWGNGSGGYNWGKEVDRLFNDPLIEVRNVGVPGRRILGTDGMLDETTGNIINSYREDYQNYLILWGGTNDVFSSATADDTYGLSDAAGIWKITSDSKDAGYRVAHLNCIARTDANASRQTQRTNLNADFAGNAAGANVVIDAAATFSDSTSGFYSDGVHLTRAAQIDTLAPLVYAAIEDVFADEAPAQVTGLSVGVASETLNASWSKPFTWGQAPTYTIEYKETSSGTWIEWASGVTGLISAITGLTNDTSYDVRVKAVNAVGGGTYSATVTATPDSFNPYALSTYDWGFDSQNRTAAGNKVSQLDDLTGLGYPLLQASGALQPSDNIDTMNGLPAITFDDVNDKMTTAGSMMHLTNGSTVFIVMNTKSDEFYLPLSDWTSSGRFVLVAQDGATGSLSAGCGTPTYRLNGVAQTWANRGQAFTSLSGAGNVLLTIENVDIPFWRGLQIGEYHTTGIYAAIAYGEIDIFGTGFTERDQTEAFLAAKYGITI